MTTQRFAWRACGHSAAVFTYTAGSACVAWGVVHGPASRGRASSELEFANLITPIQSQSQRAEQLYGQGDASLCV